MADLAAGEVFTSVTPGNLVSTARLNNHINGATILPAFVSAKPTLTPVAADRILTYKSIGDQLNSPSITQVLALQVTDAAPAVGSMRTLGLGANQAAAGDAAADLASSNVFSGVVQTFKKVATAASGSGATIAAGAGLVSPTILTVTGTDFAGRISMTPSVNTGTSAVLFTVTYGVAYSTGTAIVMLTPFNAAALLSFQTANKYVSVTTQALASFSVSSASSALTAGVNYVFTYLVIRI